MRPRIAEGATVEEQGAEPERGTLKFHRWAALIFYFEVDSIGREMANRLESFAGAIGQIHE